MPMEKTIKATGLLAIWELMNATFNQEEVKARFTDVELGRFAPRPRTPLACLSLAMSSLYTQRSNGTDESVTLTPCGEGYVAEIKRPDPITHRVATEHMIAAWLEPAGNDGALVMRCDGDIAAWNAIHDRMTEAARHIDGGAVSKALVNALCSPVMGGTVLRKAGGIYWLPTGTDGKWRTLAEGIEKAAMTGAAHCWSITTVGDEQSVRAVADAFIREMEAECASAEALVSSGEFTKEKLDNLVAKLMDRGALAEKYEEILDTALTGIRERLDDVRVKVGETANLAA